MGRPLAALANEVASSAIDRGQILIAGMAAMLITIFLGPKFIELLRAREFGQQIREEGPAEHQTKAGTPTMGGLIVFIAIAVPYLVLSPRDTQSLAVFGVALGAAGVGFADDFIKVTKRRSLGLPARWKLLAQIGLAVALWWVASDQVGLDPRLQVRISDAEIYLGPVLYVLVIFLVIAGASDGIVEVAIELIFQRRSPDRVRSRVISVLEAVFHSGLAVSFLFAGSLVDAFGPKAAYLLAGSGCAVAAIMLLPVLRDEEGTGARRLRSAFGFFRATR